MFFKQQLNNVTSDAQIFLSTCSGVRVCSEHGDAVFMLWEPRFSTNRLYLCSENQDFRPIGCIYAQRTKNFDLLVTVLWTNPYPTASKQNFEYQALHCSVAFQKHPAERSWGQQSKIHMLSLNTQWIVLIYGLTLCGLVNVWRRFRGTYCLRLQGRRESQTAACFLLVTCFALPWRWGNAFIWNVDEIIPDCCEDVKWNKCPTARHLLAFHTVLNIFMWQSSEHRGTWSATQHHSRCTRWLISVFSGCTHFIFVSLTDQGQRLNVIFLSLRHGCMPIVT
jgi:hypothetical protein